MFVNANGSNRKLVASVSEPVHTVKLLHASGTNQFALIVGVFGRVASVMISFCENGNITSSPESAVHRNGHIHSPVGTVCIFDQGKSMGAVAFPTGASSMKARKLFWTRFPLQRWFCDTDHTAVAPSSSVTDPSHSSFIL